MVRYEKIKIIRSNVPDVFEAQCERIAQEGYIPLFDFKIYSGIYYQQWAKVKQNGKD